MNTRKLLLFAILGAAGCLAGWLIGEPWLLAAMPAGSGSLASVPDPPAEFAGRLAREGGKTKGEIRISLLWDNVNDLDLHCVDPSGEVIFFQRKKSKSGGELDVDMNFRAPYSKKPVENIYWPSGRAPVGHYRIAVNHFANHGGDDPTVYEVSVQIRGELLSFKGSTKAGDEPQTVHEFDLAPAPFQWSTGAIIAFGVWSALLAVGLAVALVGGQNHYLGRPLFVPKEILPAAVGAAGAGFGAGAVGQTLFAVLTMMHLPANLGFLVGWVLLGGLVGLGLGFFIPNVDKLKSAVAGMAGGLLGAMIFLIVGFMLHVVGLGVSFPSRFLGAAVLGAAIGLMVALVEQAFRTYWLEIRLGREVRSVNLGATAISFGADAQQCTVYAAGAAPVAVRYHLAEGKVEREDVPSGKRVPVNAGEEFAIGRLVVVLHGGSSSPVTAGPVAPPPPPPPPPPPAVSKAPSRAATAPPRPVAPPTQGTLRPPPPPPPKR